MYEQGFVWAELRIVCAAPPPDADALRLLVEEFASKYGDLNKFPYRHADNVSNFPLVPDLENAHVYISWKYLEVGINGQKELVPENKVPASALAAVRSLAALPGIRCSHWGTYESLDAPWENTLYGPQLTGSSFITLLEWMSKLDVANDP